MSTLARFLLIVLLAGIGPSLAQNGVRTDSSRATSTIDNTPPGTLNPEPLPPLPNPNASDLPAKELFARKVTPLPGPVRPIGSYANGCLAGAVALPITGPTWQVMRLSRDRMGNASARQLHQTTRRQCQKGRLEWSFDWRHGATARRTNDQRALQSPDRSRRRHLVQTDARSRVVARRARNGSGRERGCAGWARCRSQSVDVGVHEGCEDCRRRSKRQ